MLERWVRVCEACLSALIRRTCGRPETMTDVVVQEPLEVEELARLKFKELPAGTEEIVEVNPV